MKLFKDKTINVPSITTPLLQHDSDNTLKVEDIEKLHLEILKILAFEPIALEHFAESIQSN